MGQQLLETTMDPRAMPYARSPAGERDVSGIPAGVLSAAFVLLWSTGYPAARIALDHSAPFTMLVLRFGGAGLLLALLAALSRAAWPRGRAALHSMLVGSLQLALQFGTLYWAASRGVNVGLIALVIGTMPIVTALLGRALYGEVIRAPQWIGFALGFAGVALAVGENVITARGSDSSAYLAVLVGLLALSIGTLCQKRYASNVDPRSGLAVQHLAATVLLLPLAFHEGWRADTSAPFFASLAWVIGMNSLSAFSLLFVLLRRGAVNQVATLFFLMPPVTAVIDYLLLGDALTAYKVAGLAVAALGVYLATRSWRDPRSRPDARSRPEPAVRATLTRARLSDGREVVIRPIEPRDLPALKRFFGKLSPATNRMRFHGSIKELPERVLREFTKADQNQHVGFIAEAHGEATDPAPLVVAEARYVRPPGSDVAEFALVVADEWHRVGIGVSLMQALLRHARLMGVRRLCGEALTDNEAIQSFLRSLGAYPVGSVGGTGTVQLCLSTGAGSAERAAKTRVSQGA